MAYKTYLCRLCFYSILSSFPSVVLAAESVDQQREQGVADIQDGKVNQGFNQLKTLLEQDPQNQKLIADYVVLRYANAKFTDSDKAYLANIDPAAFPDYGKVSVLKALRDLKQYDAAIQWAEKFSIADASPQWILWQGVLQAEAGQKNRAREILEQANLQPLDADYQSKLAYAYRLLEMPADSLHAAQRAVEGTESVDAQEQYVLALIMNSDYAKAQQYIQLKQLDASRPTLRHAMKMHEFSERIQQGIQAYKNALSMNRGEEAFILLDRVLADMQAYEAQLPADPSLRQHFYYEYIFALNARNASEQAVAQIAKTGVSAMEMPAYVRHALADSYLRMRQPKTAEKLYKSLFSEKNYADYNVYAGLYFSLIEQEKFKEADQLLLVMDKQLPTFRYSNAKGVDKTPHDDRTELISLKGLNYVYRKEHAKAERYFNDVVAQAPGNISYQNNLSIVQRWREKPELSQQTLDQWNSVEPVDQSSQIARMQTAQALGQIQSWRQQTEYLVRSASDDTGVQQSKKALDDRRHATIQHRSAYSESKSDNDALLGRLKGSKEQESGTRLSSPWFNDNYRLFADHSNRWADYEQGKIKDQRVGLGLEWASNRRTASVLLSQSTDGDRFGVQLDWSHWLNDHWSYALGFDSQADIPLQALAQGHEGEAYTMSLNWQANESRKAGAAYKLTDINDGNARQEFSAFFKQQLLQGPHYITSAALRGGYERNDLGEYAPYFNPDHSYSAEAVLEHDWITWRSYDRQFSQHFEATAGTFKQRGYSGKPIYNLYYQHDWQLSRTWKLNYGIGWGQHSYDGEDEKRTYAVLGFEGRF